MKDVTDQAQMPEVTVAAKRPRPQASWSDVAAGIPTAIGAGIESKVAGAQEFLGRTAYDDARKKFWQATILPQAVQDAKQQNVALTDLPEVQDTARHLGIRPDTFTRDWPTYVNQPDEQLNDFKAQQRDRLQAGAQQIASGTRKRLTAQEVREAYAPNMDEHSLKSLVFDAATMAPDVLAGVAGTVATGGAGGAAIMAADIAPNMYAEARNRGLDHDQASTYAVLSTLASSVPEVPVLKIVENTPLARKVIGGIVGEKLASTAAGKVAGTAAAQGVTQSVVNALQQGIDAGVLNEHLPLNEALKQVAWSGLVGGVVGAPMGAYHAVTSRERKPTTFLEHPEVGGGNGVDETAPGLAAGEVSAAAEDPSSSMAAEPPQEVNRASEANPEEEQAPSVAPPSVERSPAPIEPPAEQKGDTEAKNNSPTPEGERAALQAVKNKTVTPPQAAMLEDLGLVRRNDLGEPLLLPKGRRRIAELNAMGDSADTPKIPVQTVLKGGETGSEPPISTVEAPAEPEKQAEVSRNEPEPAQVPAQERTNGPATTENRIATDQDLRDGLTAMKAETGWAQVGGRVMRDATTDQVSGRTTWIPNAEWWPGRPKGLKESDVHAAIDKALAGQPLRRREQAMVDYMTHVHDERAAMAQTHQELVEAVPDLPKQPEGSLDLTLLASRAAEFDSNEAARIMDTWEDDKPETIARVRGQFEQIIGRGHGNQESLELTSQEGGAGQPAPAKRTPAALDLFGEDRTREQALADETQRRDAQRSPNRDVPVETGLPGDLFSQSRRQVDFTDQLKQARTETHTEPSDGQKDAGNYRKGRINFGGMEVALENPKGSTRSGVGDDGRPWSSRLKHDYGYFAGTEGADGDALDVFLTGKPDTGKMYVINQVDPESGRFDEIKAIGGAESAKEAQDVYHANYPRGWKGLGSMAEVPTAKFKQWSESGNTHNPYPGAERVERREAGGARRAKVAEMSPEQLRKELLTHELTGIPNRRAYTEAKKLPHQISIDVDSLKWVNDNMGHESGNELLKAVASSLSSHSDNVFHLSGDEFAAQSHTETEAHELMRNVAEHLKGAGIEVEMPDGRLVKLKGLGVSYGVGKTLEEADAALSSHKARRQAEGARAGRGEAPPGAVVRAREEGRENQAGGSAEGVGPKSARRKQYTREELERLPIEKLDKMAFGVKTGDVVKLKPSDINIKYSGDLENPQAKFDKGGMAWARSVDLREPIEVSIDNEGRYQLEDGHHRWFAAGKTGRELTAQIEVKGKPIEVILKRQQLKSRRTGAASAGLPRADVERIVHQTIRETNLVSGFPHVEVHEDVSSLPEHIKSLIEQQGAQGLTGAAYDPSTGRIHLIAANNGSESEVRENLWHEAVGHHGLRLAMDRPQYNAIMDGIARDMPERVEASAQRNGLDLGDLEQKRAAAEEVVAYAAGQQLSGQSIDKPVLPYWTRAVRAVKAFFSRMAGKPFYDDTAIAGLIQQAHQALERGSIGSTAGEPLRSTRAPTYYSPVERAVTGSKQAKASADQWLATIKKMPGVKPEELEYLGLEDWLHSVAKSGEPAHAESVVDGAVGHAEAMRDLVETEPFRAKGFGGLEIPRKAAVLKEMFAAAKNAQVREAILGALPVSVVDILGGKQRASDRLFHDSSVFEDLFSSKPNVDVAIGPEVATSVIRAVTARIAEMAREPPHMYRAPDEGRVAGGANSRGQRKPRLISKNEILDYIRANKLDLHETQHGAGAQTEDERSQIQVAEKLRARGYDVVFHTDGNLDSIAIPGPDGLKRYRLEDDPDALYEAAEREGADVSKDVQNLSDISTRVSLYREAERHVGEGEYDASDDRPANIERGNRYGEYTLPGGKNYRELLIRLPSHPVDVIGPSGEVVSTHRTIEEARGQVVAEPGRSVRSTDYRSGHWNEPNIVAHTRFNERTDADGKKVLFIEEIQSDWHQQGRKRGYLDPQKVSRLEAENKAAKQEAERLANAVRRTRRADFDGTAEDVQQANDARRAAEERQQAIERDLIASRETVPDAPFKTSWPMLVMKRMVRWAAEKGFDRIAWTTGAQQAERYNLARHVDTIHYSKDVDGKYWLFMEKDNQEVGRDINSHGYTEADLRELVGDEVAQKIINGEGRYTSMDPAVKYPERVLEGLDIQTGGQGMRGFYDQILPRETDKLIKKYGGRVGKVTVKLDNAPDDVVEKWAQKDPNHPFVLKNRSEQHGFDITQEIKQAALGEGFPMFARRQQDLPLEENRERGAYAAVRRALNAVHESKAVRDVRKLGNPVGMSAESKQVAQIARSALGELAHETVQTQEALEHFSRDIDKLPITDQLEMMDAIERGAEQPHPELQPVADEMRKTLDTWREKVRGLGEGYLDHFIENYFPHYWRDESEAQRMVASIMGRRPLRGPASFLKMRTIPSIKEGMDAGLTPLTTNPLIMTLLKAREMQRFVTGVTLMRRFKEDGLARFLRSGLPMLDGWAPINDSIAKVRQWSEAEAGFIDRGQYIMPVDAARVINNHLSGSALRDFAPAQIFRRGANALNALQLGFSAFHLGFTTLDAMISKNAQGIERLMHGDVAGAAKSFGEGVTPVGAVRNVHRGYKLLEAYSDPVGATPEMAKLVKMLELAGGRAHMDRYYLATEGFSPFRGVGVRSLASDIHKALTAPQDKLERLGQAVGSFPAEYGNKLWKGLQEIWQTTPAMEVPIEVTARIVRASTAWIMEHLVPMQKLGVFSDLAADHLKRNPVEDPNARAAAMQRIWDSVDNRLGEMVYDNLFWNRTLKDTLHLGIRAVGWNLGTIREIGGAPVDLVKAVNKRLTTGELSAADLGHRIPYVLAMTATTALYAAVYQYLATGQGPQELKDYFFPRTGGLTNYGTPQRVSLPSYVKDVYEYSQQPGTTVVNKLNPIFSLIGNLYSNQDFFGNPITDPEADYWHKKLQQLEFVGKEATPFSFQGRQQMQASEQGGGIGATVRKVLPMVGVTPAPGYITSPDQIERRNRLEQDKKYTSELKYKMKRALLAKDKAAAKVLATQYAEAVKRMSQTQKLVDQDKGKAAAARRKAAISMRHAGLPATANLVASLPLDPDHLARQYFTQQSVTAS